MAIQKKKKIDLRFSKADKVATLLPRVAERYQTLVDNLGSLSQMYVAQAREQIRD
jgi:hypothetical protein